MRVLITGTTTFFAPRLIQQFGRHGAKITAADSLRLSAGKSSRWTNQALMVPRLGKSPGAFLAALLAELRSQSYDLLLPTFEESLLLAEYREDICRETRMFLPTFETMMSLHFKPSLYELCMNWGIDCPKSVHLTDPHAVESATKLLRYPVILKPSAGNNSVGKLVCETPAQMHRGQELLMFRGGQPCPPVVQEKIDGDLICNLMYCHNGRKLGEVIYRNLRTLPDDGGTSVVRESIEHSQIARIAEKIVRSTHWSGFLGLDFIVEKNTRIPYLIDANPRANPGVKLGYHTGVDWTGIMTKLMNGSDPEFVQGRPGVRVRSLLMDVAWLIDGFRIQRGFFRRAAGRVKQFFVPPWKYDRHTSLVRRLDWKPKFILTLHALRSWIQAGLTGKPVGQVMLDDANYDPRSAAQLAGYDPGSPIATRPAA